MKMTFLKILIGLLLAFNINVVSSQAWVPVGEEQFSSVYYPSLAMDSNNSPYLFYKDYSDNNRGVVSKFENDIWEQVGNSPFSELIYPGIFGTTSSWATHSLSIDNNNILYTAYINQNGAVCVKKVENESWLFVGQNPIAEGEYISLAIDNNNAPHIAYFLYSEDNETEGHYVVVKKYEADNWQTIGEPIFVDIIFGRKNNSLLFDNDNNLYLAYLMEDIITGLYNIKIKKFENGIWLDVTDPEAFSDYFDFGFAIDSQNKLYIAYTDKEDNNDNNVTVKKLEGNSWQVVGEIEMEGYYQWFMTLNIDNNDIPYLSYTIENHNPFTYTATVKKFENDDWQNVGSPENIEGIFPIVFDTNNIPFSAFTNRNSNGVLITTVKKFDPTAGVATSVFNQVEMYPNPANENVTFTNLPENTNITIIDLTGKLIYSTKTAATSLTINTTGFTSGLYLVELTGNEGNTIKKLVIK